MDDQQKTLINLLNPSFTFQFGDKDYQVRRANIEQIQKYQLRTTEVLKNKDVSVVIKDMELLSYAVFLILYEIDNTITEEFVKKNFPGNKVDGFSLLLDLGFINPQNVEIARKLQEKLISEKSSQTSPS